MGGRKVGTEFGKKRRLRRRKRFWNEWEQTRRKRG